MPKGVIWQQMKPVLVVILASFAAILLYAFLHEGGHALAVWLLGGRVTAFDINFITGNPSVSHSGNYSNSGRALISIAGPILPCLVSLAIVPWIDRIRYSAIQVMLLIYSLTMISSLLPQVILPHASRFGGDLGNEDIIRFIAYSGWSPWLVSILFLSLILFSAWYWWRVGRLGRLLTRLNTHYRLRMPGRKTRLALGLLFLAFLTAVSIRLVMPEKLDLPPNDYTHIEAVFSDLDTSVAEVYSFSTTRLEAYDFFYSLVVDTPVRLDLVTENENGFTFNRKKRVTLYEGSQNVKLGRFTGFLLEPGTYRLELHGTDRPGRLDLYTASTETNEAMLQHYALQQAVNTQSFTADLYQEDGYRLVYQNEPAKPADELVHTFTRDGFIQVSAFFVGEFDALRLYYTGGEQEIDLLDSLNMTVGFGFQVNKDDELRLNVDGAKGTLFVYVNE